MADGTDAILEMVEAAWRPLREAAGRLTERLESTTSAGWTAKEMLAHVAFWDEAVVGVVVGMFRHQPRPEGWTFGSGYLPAQGEGWPTADVHNAREAAWARTRTEADVLARLDRSHGQLLDLLATVTDREVVDHAGYFRRLPSHYIEHQPELEGLEASP